MDYKSRMNSWLKDPAIDESTKKEILAIEDEGLLTDMFYKELEFGTAGLRGIMGIGTNRMNSYVVARATQGVANSLLATEGNAEKGVVIAFDSRNHSGEFALSTALVLCANGIKTYLFDSVRSVPQLSFSIGYLGCCAGIVITASHNPSPYNGYKVFGDNGAQINPVQAEKITKNILAIDSYAQVKTMSREDAIASGKLVMLSPEVDEAYYAYTEGLVLDRAVLEGASGLKIVYTPLFGAGNVPVRRILKAAGVQQLHVVESQSEPNGDFPGLEAPNPETKEAYIEASKLAKEVGADLILATDPDSDRLGIAVSDGKGDFKTLTGNQIACIILHYRLSKLKEQGKLPENGLVVKSIVSTKFADAICNSFGVRIDGVLTGFRFIGEKIDDGEKSGETAFLFGFEESYGFLSGTRVRDKDAIAAALMAAEVAAYWSAQGKNLLQALDVLFEEYGYFSETVKSYTLTGIDGMERIAAIMSRLHEEYPAAIANEPVTAVADYKKRKRTANGESLPVSLPASDVLYYELGDYDWVCVRPSGTEPKLKVYAGATGKTWEEAKARSDAFMASTEELLGM